MRVEMVRSGLVVLTYGTMTIVAGADVPKNKVVETPIFLVDCFPSIVEAVGGHLVEEDRIYRVNLFGRLPKHPIKIGLLLANTMRLAQRMPSTCFVIGDTKYLLC